jgi:type I restriction enzyme R subunit
MKQIEDRNEEQTKFDLITPAVVKKGWNTLEYSRVLLEYPITKGKLIGEGKTTKPLQADYVLKYKEHNLAVIEAKRESLPHTDGLEQVKDYAKKLEVPFAYATNGHKIRELNMITSEVIDVDEYPTPDELWERIYPKTNNWQDNFSKIPFKDVWGDGYLRFYQELAMKKVLESVANGNNRILLTMATGTGKTNTAFQICWKLFHSKWTKDGQQNRTPRILFLADRNILANQAYLSFLKGFEDEKALIRIKPDEIKKRGEVPKHGSIFFTIYQTFMSGEDHSPYFGEYPADFFDFIIIDECHRGGAKDESTWRKILEYFSSAVQLGLTATPKRTNNADTYKYFGEPVYTYSLKEGIDDGFLTPYRVQRFRTSEDEFKIKEGDKIIKGKANVGETFTEQDFNNSKIDVKERTEKRVDLFLNNSQKNDKTLIFCYTQKHAADVRDYIDVKKKVMETDYVCRVTANDGKFGDQHLKEFQDNEKTIPTILTTSEKLSTGVDARNVRNVVFLRMPNNMIEFKQIIGRGTRLYEGKDYFTIYDFVGASELFQDSDWDGEPMETNAPKSKKSTIPRTSSNKRKTEEIEVVLGSGRKQKITYTLDTSFYLADGRVITAQEFTEILFGELPKLFKDEKELRRIWSDMNTRKKILDKLHDSGYGGEQFVRLKEIMGCSDSDIYDFLIHVRFDTKPITRHERIENAIITLKNKYNETQLDFIDFIFNKYEERGVKELSKENLKDLIEMKYGGMFDIPKEIGGAKGALELYQICQQELYAA